MFCMPFCSCFMLFHLCRPPYTPIWHRYLDALLLMDPQLSHGALRLFLGLPVLPASITLDAWNGRFDDHRFPKINSPTGRGDKWHASFDSSDMDSTLGCPFCIAFFSDGDGMKNLSLCGQIRLLRKLPCMMCICQRSVGKRPARCCSLWLGFAETYTCWHVEIPLLYPLVF